MCIRDRAGIAIGIIFFLAPKTPAVIIVCLILIFLLLLHPLWNFWWIERKRGLQFLSICILGVCVAFWGFFIWPTVEITPTAITVSPTVGETVTIRNNRADDAFEIYVKIYTDEVGCSETNNLEIVNEMGQEVITQEKISGLVVNYSHFILHMDCQTNRHEKRQAEKRPAFQIKDKSESDQLFFLNCRTATPAKPRPSRKIVEGSGTDEAGSGYVRQS